MNECLRSYSYKLNERKGAAAVHFSLQIWNLREAVTKLQVPGSSRFNVRSKFQTVRFFQSRRKLENGKWKMENGNWNWSWYLPSLPYQCIVHASHKLISHKCVIYLLHYLRPLIYQLANIGLCC